MFHCPVFSLVPLLLLFLSITIITIIINTNNKYIKLTHLIKRLKSATSKYKIIINCMHMHDNTYIQLSCSAVQNSTVSRRQLLTRQAHTGALSAWLTSAMSSDCRPATDTHTLVDGAIYGILSNEIWCMTDSCWLNCSTMLTLPSTVWSGEWYPSGYFWDSDSLGTVTNAQKSRRYELQ